MIKRSTARAYRYIRFRKGHGVHSPFAFGLINKVIEEKRPFYIFEEIETKSLRTRLKISTGDKYGRLLYRLIMFFHPRNIIQIGPADEKRMKYLQAAAPQMIIVEKDHISRIDDLSKTEGSFEFVFFNLSKNPALTKELLDKCLNHVNENTVFVVDGIHKKKMESFWIELKNRQDIPITMDLYTLGLVFFKQKMYKKNYKLFF